MRSTKLIYLLVAITLQGCIPQNDAVSTGHLPPEELLKNLEQVIKVAINSSTTKLENLREDYDKKVTTSMENAGKDIDAKFDNYLNTLEQMKEDAIAEGKIVDDCFPGKAKAFLDLTDVYHRRIYDCGDNKIRVGDAVINDAIQKTEATHNEIFEISKEIRHCDYHTRHPIDCRHKVAAKIRREIAETPSKIESNVADATKVIQSIALDECTSDNVAALTKDGDGILLDVWICIANKTVTSTTTEGTTGSTQPTPSPADLVEELRQTVYKAVASADAELEAIRANYNNQTANASTDSNGLLDYQYKVILDNLNNIKFEAETSGVNISECLGGSEGQLDYLHSHYITHAMYCDIGTRYDISSAFDNAIYDVYHTKDLAPNLEDELKNCGNSTTCKENVAEKATLAIASEPPKIESYVAFFAQRSQEIAASLEKCLLDDVNLLGVEGKQIINEVSTCVSETINSTSTLTPVTTPHASTPEDLLQDLRRVIYETVENAASQLEKLKQNFYNNSDKIASDSQVLINREFNTLVAKLNNIKDQAEASGVDISDCLGTSEEKLEYSRSHNAQHSNYCGFGSRSDGSVAYDDAAHAVFRSKNLASDLHKELEDCGTSATCRANVAEKISQTIASEPEKVNSNVAVFVNKVENILASQKQCGTDDANQLDVEGQRVINEVSACLSNKLCLS